MQDQAEAQAESTPAPDLAAIAEQTQPAALRLLKKPALKALQADLRAMREKAGDVETARALGQAIRRLGVEKRRRMAKNDDADAAPAPAATPAKAEKQRLRDERKAEKQQAREAEKADRKARKQAERAAGQQAAAKDGEPSGG